MPQPGEVFIHKNYTFEDGSQRDKWFIALNASDLNNPCIVLKTTSVSRRYFGCVQGCNKTKKCFFAPSSWQTCFTVDTYIQLPQIIEFPTLDLINKCQSNIIEFKGSLTDKCFEQLKTCLTGFKDDIMPRHWKMIYKKE